MSEQPPSAAELSASASQTSTVIPAGAVASSSCASCGQASSPLAAAMGNPLSLARPAGFAYGVGRLNARFPSLGAEREYAQLSGADPDAIVRTGDLRETLSKKQNRYLARQMCWVFSGRGTDAFVVAPRDGDDLSELLAALSDNESSLQVVVGSPAALTPSVGACVLSGLPIVQPDQIFAFTRDAFMDALPAPNAPKERDLWKRTAAVVFDQLTQRGDNRGLSDQHRAMNYLALRYPQLYHLAFGEQSAGAPLIGVDARPGQAVDRRLVEIRFAFRDSHTHVVKRYLCRVDVTDLFPFLTTPLMPTFD